MTEAQISREIVDFLRMVGWAVYDTGQGYRREPGGTRITAGLADLVCIGHGRALFVEVKSQRGRLRDSQREFAGHCADNGVACVCWRSVGEAWDWHVEQGLLEEAAS